MASKEEWKEIEEYVSLKDSERFGQYGFDTDEELEKIKKVKNNHTIKKITKAIKVSLIIVITIIMLFTISTLLLLLYAYYGSARSAININTKKYVETKCEEKVKFITKDVDYNKNGLYTYKVKNKDIPIHLVKKWENFETDIEAQYHKYYFEQWEDEEKNKFVIEEGSATTKFYPNMTQDWMLSYKTYINVNNYQEMLDATEAIIRFLQYMNKPNMKPEIYVRYKDVDISIYTYYKTTYDGIRERVKSQFNKMR